VDVLIFRLKEIFEAIHFNTRVVSLKEREGGVDVKFEGGVTKTEQTFDRVLIAVGRKPNTENLGLEKTKVKLSVHAISQTINSSSNSRILVVPSIPKNRCT
jgi:dihydrolipoamide dehydrogenase